MGKTGVVSFYHDPNNTAANLPTSPRQDTTNKQGPTNKDETPKEIEKKKEGADEENERAVVEFYDAERALKSSWLYTPSCGENVGKAPYCKFPALSGYGPFRLLRSGLL